MSTYTIDERYTDSEYTAAGNVAAVFGTPRRIESITIHHWGNTGQTHDGVVNFFLNHVSNTSAHFVVSDGRIHCLISPADASWAAGNAYGNATSIHIECRPEATEGDYATVAWLVKFLRDNYGANLPLIPHRDWQATACPGVWDLSRIDAIARGLTPAATKPAPNPAGPYEPDPHWRVDPGDTLSMIAKHYGRSVKAIATYNGIKDVNRLTVGEIVWPPTGRDTWTVDPGDTLNKIATFYGITVDSICYANGINDPNHLKVGTRLQIP